MGEAIPIVQERETTMWQLPSYLTLKFKISFKNQVNQFQILASLVMLFQNCKLSHFKILGKILI